MTAGPALAAQKTSGRQQIVRAGIYEYPKYAERDKNGIWTGYDAEMLENIAQTAGFSVQFVPFAPSVNSIANFANSSVDMLCDIAKTPEREAKYLFSDYEQGSTSTCIVIKKDNDAVRYGDLEQISGLTCAVQDGSFSVKQYEAWCRKHGYAPKVKVYDTLSKMLAALDSGETDAALLTDDSARSGKYRIVLSLAQTPYYYMFAKSNRKLKNQVDAAAAGIFGLNPLYEQNLKQKYGINSFASTALTKEEKEYIAVHPNAEIAVVENDAPYYHAGPGGIAQGILPDLYALISKNTGLSFSFHAYATQREAAEAVLSGRADILGVFSNGIPYAYNAGLRLTSGYSNVSLVMLSRSGTAAKNIKKIAIKRRCADAVKNRLVLQTGGAEFIERDSATGCFDALKSGAADALVVGLPSATWIINQTNSSAYSFVPLSGAGIDLAAAVSHENGTLADILSNGIRQTTDLFNGIVSNNTGPGDSLQVTVSRIPAAAIVAFDSVMFLVVVFLIWAIFAVAKSRQIKIAAIRAEAAADEQRIKAEAMEKNAEEKNAFFSNISHDMRTPLNGILGFADLAEKAGSLDKARDYIAKIKLSGSLLLRLINDTLTISKINSGKLELKPEPADTASLTEGIIGSIHSLAAQKGVDFTFDDAGLRRRTVLADRLNIEKAFLNLLSNAVKFTPPGGHVRFTVQDEPQGAADPDLVAVVRDDGIGMSSEYLQHMYEPFSQEKRHGYDSVGTGLGLSIVKQLVELMGGTIEAQSRIGAGTVFTVRLHLKETFAAQTPAQTGRAAKKPVSLKGAKVLLCEDNALNREIAAAMLREQGITAVAAENGKIGAELFSGSAPGEFAAILMDLRMPVMDGYEATKQIRTLARADAKTVPIIAMTADAFEEDIHKCRAAGMNGHIAKPIDPELLNQSLAKAITAAE